MVQSFLNHHFGPAISSPSSRQILVCTTVDSASVYKQRRRTESKTWRSAGLREELHIKDARMARTKPRRLPIYPSRHRWSVPATYRSFLPGFHTISYWNQRFREDCLDVRIVRVLMMAKSLRY